MRQVTIPLVCLGAAGAVALGALRPHDPEVLPPPVPMPMVHPTVSPEPMPTIDLPDIGI